MPPRFVHVHNHTEYSLLDGANRIPELVKRCVDLEMEALAISDHGVMFGAMEFYFECMKKGVKPLLGMEAYVAPNGHLIKTGKEENQTYHLLLLAKNNEGYRNLCKLHSTAALSGFYYKPRIDHELLREHAGGLIGTSACLGSEVCKALMAGDYQGAKDRAAMYREIFDEDSFFIELQDHRLPEQAAIRSDLIRIARELKLPLLATNDAHYLCKESHAAHDVLLCIGTGALLSDEKRLRFTTDEFYLKSPEEMAALFSDVPEAIENSLRIAEMCNVELGKKRAPMPEPDLPPGYEVRQYLREIAEKGLAERVSNADEEAFARLNYELDVIAKTGFDDYFLLVREFASFTRQQGIAFGVRGSAAGSLVSYCVGITDVNPLEYDLTFERFLNPERISMPDIDMDFEDARRDEVIKWVTEKYGSDRVAQIVTFGTLGAKAAIKDAGRVKGYSPQETDRICKTIPNTPGTTLESALERSNDFKKLVETEPKVKELFDVAKEIEGTSRHAGVHAAGVVISKDPLSDHIPLYRGNDGQPVTAFEMGILEKIGLLKMDFLGLSNLTVLARTVDNINARDARKAGREPVAAAASDQRALGNEWGNAFNIADIPFDDGPTFDMLSNGDTVGVFQLESGGMRRNIIELKPTSVRELAAMVALYRPGPMEHIPTYVDSKFGRREVVYLHEKMRPILEETYGVIVYQDQVLKLVQALAGFSLGKADILRRAMGKKDKAAMDEMYSEFVEGGLANGVSKEISDQVWKLLEPFAGYAFNKAHAVCYSILAYQTAYLKANFCVEYMAALLAVYQGREDKVTTFIEECRHQHIMVLAPDVNRSYLDFSIESIPKPGTKGETEEAIRFGLAAIKGVGESLVRGIIEEREKGSFTHIYEFAERVKPAGLNRTALDALVRAGALDSIDKNRKRLAERIEGALAYAEIHHRSRIAGQDSLFGGGDDQEDLGPDYPVLPDCEPYSRAEILAMEKEVMGIYVSDHPLRGLERALREACSHSCSLISELEEQTPVRLAGVLAGVRVVTTKKGDRMANLVIEDFTGQVSCTVFPATYAKCSDIIERDRLVTIKGAVTYRERFGGGGERTVEIRVEYIEALKAEPEDVDYTEDDQEPGHVVVRIQRATKAELSALKEAMMKTPGQYRVKLEFGDSNEVFPLELRYRIDWSPTVEANIKAVMRGIEVEFVRNRFLNPSLSVDYANASNDDANSDLLVI